MEKPFFPQFLVLQRQVPRASLFQTRAVDCDYASFIADSKNVYLSTSILKSENVFYSHIVARSRDVVDAVAMGDGELLYENIEGAKNARSAYLVRSRECLNSAYLFDCVNCQQCSMSTNLRNKKFVMRNRQYTESAYNEELRKMNMGSFTVAKQLREEFMTMIARSLHKFGQIVKSVDCFGDNIMNAKSAHHCFDIHGGENLKYVTRAVNAKESYDVTGNAAELVYEGVATIFDTYDAKFSTFVEAVQRSRYSDTCQNGTDLFGCIGIRKKSYCVLNKQYTKAEYDALVPKIVEHMNAMPYIDAGGRVYRYGEFFPIELSPFAYNETLANDHFPLTRDAAIGAGYRWRDEEKKNYVSTIAADRLPDDIRDVQDSILQEVIACAHAGACNDRCTVAFRLVPYELQFYRRMNIPLPRLCPNCRHYDRFRKRNPLKLWRRKCTCSGLKSENSIYANTAQHVHGDAPCPNEFETSYAPDRPETVYCEQCYNAEVV